MALQMQKASRGVKCRLSKAGINNTEAPKDNVLTSMAGGVLADQKHYIDKLFRASGRAGF